MKLEDNKDQIDAYFDSKTPEQIVARLTEIGVEFSPLADEDDYYIPSASDIEELNREVLYAVPFAKNMTAFEASWTNNFGSVKTTFTDAEVSSFSEEAETFDNAEELALAA